MSIIKKKIYEVQKKIENKITNFISVNIEWISKNYTEIKKKDKDEVIQFLETLEDDDDVQNVFTNAKFIE